jgi:hypothetical protein
VPCSAQLVSEIFLKTIKSKLEFIAEPIKPYSKTIKHSSRMTLSYLTLVEKLIETVGLKAWGDYF